MQSIDIVIDVRERSPTIRKTLTAMEGITCEVRRLKMGDFQVGKQRGRIIIINY